MTTKNPCHIAIATKDYYFSVEIKIIENFIRFKFPDGRTITIEAKEFGGLPHKLNGNEAVCVSMDELAQSSTD